MLVVSSSNITLSLINGMQACKPKSAIGEHGNLKLMDHTLMTRREAIEIPKNRFASKRLLVRPVGPFGAALACAVEPRTQYSLICTRLS